MSELDKSMDTQEAQQGQDFEALRKELEALKAQIAEKDKQIEELLDKNKDLEGKLQAIVAMYNQAPPEPPEAEKSEPDPFADLSGDVYDDKVIQAMKLLAERQKAVEEKLKKMDELEKALGMVIPTTVELTAERTIQAVKEKVERTLTNEFGGLPKSLRGYLDSTFQSLKFFLSKGELQANPDDIAKAIIEAAKRNWEEFGKEYLEWKQKQNSTPPVGSGSGSGIEVPKLKEWSRDGFTEGFRRFLQKFSAGGKP